jgi:hypothetical protein
MRVCAPSCDPIGATSWRPDARYLRISTVVLSFDRKRSFTKKRRDHLYQV